MTNLNKNEAKKNFFFEKKNSKWPTQKNWVFQLPPKAEQLSPKFHRLVLFDFFFSKKNCFILIQISHNLWDTKNFFEILMITLISSKNLGGDRNMNNTVYSLKSWQHLMEKFWKMSGKSFGGFVWKIEIFTSWKSLWPQCGPLLKEKCISNWNALALAGVN